MCRFHPQTFLWVYEVLQKKNKKKKQRLVFTTALWTNKTKHFQFNLSHIFLSRKLKLLFHFHDSIPKHIPLMILGWEIIFMLRLGTKFVKCMLIHTILFFLFVSSSCLNNELSEAWRSKFWNERSQVKIAALEEDLDERDLCRRLQLPHSYGTIWSLSSVSVTGIKTVHPVHPFSIQCTKPVCTEGFPIAPGTKTIYYLPHLQYQQVLLWKKWRKKVVHCSMTPPRLKDFDVKPRWDFTLTAQSRILWKSS